MKWFSFFGAAAACSALAGSPSHATSIDIANADFEASATGADGDVPGFVVDHGYAVILQAGAPHGQVLDLNVDNNDLSNPQAQAHQILTSAFTATNYNFRADVIAPYNFQGYPGGLTVSLLDATTSAVVGSGTFAPSDSSWTTLDFGVVVPTGSAVIGDPIELVIAHNDAGDAIIDNLSLTTGQAVPEPTAWAMMLVGAGLVGAAMRRRNVGAMGLT